jgi:hypothetical protein
MVPAVPGVLAGRAATVRHAGRGGMVRSRRAYELVSDLLSGGG